MFLKILNSKKEKVLGIDISPDRLCFSYAEETVESIDLKDYYSLSFDDEIVKNGNIVDEEKILGLLNEFVEKNALKKTAIKLSISSNDAYIKKITLPDLPESELSMVVLQEIEKNLPLSVNELYVDFSVVRHFVDPVDHNRKADVVYVAAQKSVVQNFINLVEQTGLKVKSVEISSFAAIKTLTATESSMFDGSNNVAIFMDYENTDIVFLQNAVPVEIRTVPSGRKDIKSLYNEIAVLSEEEKIAYIDKLELIIDEICSEISNMIQEFYTQNSGERLVEKVYVLSRDEVKDKLLQYISEKIGINSVEKLSDNSNELIISSGLMQESSVSILNLNILDGVLSHQDGSAEFLTKDEKKKLIVIYGVFSAIFFLAFCFWGYLFLSDSSVKSQNDTLEKQYNQIKPRLERIYAESEGLKDKKEITRFKLLAKDIVEKDIISWYGILSDISLVVPKNVKIKEIAKADRRDANNTIVISGQIDAANPDPLKYISFFAININHNLPDTTKLTGASIKDVNFNEIENYYDFSITSEIKE